MPVPKIAIVIPVFNEAAVLPELCARLDALFAAQPDCAWEAILVDDGSRDSSAALIRAQAARDPRYRHPYYWAAYYAAGTAHVHISEVFHGNSR